MYTIQRFYKQCLQVNNILNILDTNIDVITKENMYIHDPFVGVCVNNFKEYMDNRAYYIICLKRLLEFHGIEVHTMYNDVKDGENILALMETSNTTTNINRDTYLNSIVNADDVDETTYQVYDKNNKHTDNDTHTKKYSNTR